MLSAITLLLPVASAWAEWQESIILKTGVPLSANQTATARAMGIANVDRVRLRAVRQIPPVNWVLRSIGEKLGLISDNTIGMTLRYGIFIRQDNWGDHRLLVHELAHVVQYERLGGFRGFLKQYLKECINPGYPFGALEQEAKQAEWDYC
jgi:hypothetical protein